MAQIGHRGKHSNGTRRATRGELEFERNKRRSSGQTLIYSLQRFCIEVPACYGSASRSSVPSWGAVPEGLHVLRSINRGSYSYAQQHGGVGDSPIHVLFHARLWPVPLETKVSHQNGGIAGGESTKGYGEGTSTAEPLRLTIDIARLGIGSKGDFSVKLRKGHVIQQAAGACYSGDIGGIVKLIVVRIGSHRTLYR
jgi:hypothetical protein